MGIIINILGNFDLQKSFVIILTMYTIWDREEKKNSSWNCQNNLNLISAKVCQISISSPYLFYYLFSSPTLLNLVIIRKLDY